MKFKLDDLQEDKEKENEKIKEEIINQPISLIEQLEKQKQEIELRLIEETKKQEEERKLKEEQEKKQREEEERKIKEEEERKLKIEEEKRIKEEAKKKKQSIPKNVRVIIWNHYIGEDIIKHKCLCCKKATITNTNFEVGHVLSEKNGGTHEINNLRPICFACNHSMGSENMVDFVIKYGLYIG
jgi:5-methylcytosine-specific restriction endonuclease McrA